ncbi:MAG: hypothetical protein DWQ11_17595 [Proteobacteria bacterium]|nr:MAG: hypothetical protein DWQ11_17595 [Pseudomonadota bacterium]
MTSTDGLMSVAAAADLIREGHFLSLAGDEAVLRQLPPGNWIGGTIPYFMTAAGGIVSRDRVHVQQAVGFLSPPRLRIYDVASLPQLCRNAPEHGYSLLIVPAFSACHSAFARHAPEYEDMYLKPLAGWVAGTHLDEPGHGVPRVVHGPTGLFSDQHAVVMDVELPPNRFASVDIVNPFKPGEGDIIDFAVPGFVVETCRVNGHPTHLADYLAARQVDIRLPLVADYCGASVNVSFRHVDPATRRVEFYAPVFPGLGYRLAVPAGAPAPGHGAASATFACNCILNFLHHGQDGFAAGGLSGPATFGEIGYQLLNQTGVYLTVR